MRTTDTDQLHSFWMTLWNDLLRFKYALSEQEVQKAMISVNQSERHAFWAKFGEALRTLVVVPKPKETTNVFVCQEIPERSYKKWLEQTRIEVPSELRGKFAPKQLPHTAGQAFKRFTYEATDLSVLLDISRWFPGIFETPFDSRICACSLSLVEEFVREADRGERSQNAICDPSSDNMFIVSGKDGFITVSVKKKLGTWHMRRIQSGDRLRSIEAYLFQ